MSDSSGTSPTWLIVPCFPTITIAQSLQQELRVELEPAGAQEGVTVAGSGPTTGTDEIGKWRAFLSQAGQRGWRLIGGGRDEWFIEGDPEWEQFVDHVGRPWWWRQRGGP